MVKAKSKVRPVEKVWRELCELQSADAIAQMLFHEGVIGKRKEATACPLAMWLWRETGLHAHVNTDEIAVGNHGDTSDYPTTSAIAEFVSMVDCGMYPQLCGETPSQGMEGPPW